VNPAEGGRDGPALREALERAQNPKRYPYLGALARGSRDALTDEETTEYLRVVGASGIPSQVHAILLLLPATGLRIKEACKLRRCDVQKRGGRLGLVVLGKGSKVRWVPCNAFGGEATTVLRDYDAAIVKGGTTSEAPLFPALKGRTEGATVAIGTVEGHLKRLREENWNDDEGRLLTVTPHVLRHTCATRLLRAKVPIELVQRILGHSDIATTLRYSHPTDEDLANALD
jgi:integrase